MLQNISRFSVIDILIFKYILWKDKERYNVSNAWEIYVNILNYACEILVVNPTDMHLALMHEFDRVLKKLNVTDKNFNECDMYNEMLEHNIEEELKNL